LKEQFILIIRTYYIETGIKVFEARSRIETDICDSLKERIKSILEANL